MPIKRVSTTWRSPSVCSDGLSDVSVGKASGRKRNVSASGDGTGVETSRASPTKKHKKALPGSPEYESQRPVTITTKGSVKSISRKLSFGSIDDGSYVRDPGHVRVDDEELAPGEEKRLRKPSKKALYMDSSLENKEHSSDKNRQGYGTTTKKVASRQQTNSPSKSDVRKTSRSPSLGEFARNAAAMVKAEPVSDDASLTPINASKTKGKRKVQPSSPINISSDEDGAADPDVDETPKFVKRADKSPIKAFGRDRASSVVSATPDDLPSSVLSATDNKSTTVPSPVSVFTIHPSDSMKGPAYAPQDLRDPETEKPIFLQPHCFDAIFEPPIVISLDAAANFEYCNPFVNPATVSPEELSIGDFKHLIWPGSKQNAVFTMLGAVSSCDIINSTTIGSHRYRAITIIPHGPSFAGFTTFLERKYACSDMFGPFEFGCLLTFSSRREGLSSSYGSSSHVQNTKRNMKAFGPSANAPPAALWFEKQFPPFMNFDQDIPIYDAHSNPFMFTKEDFTRLPHLPRFKKFGDPKLADLPPNSLVTVFFTMNTYASTRAPPTPSTLRTPVAGSSSSRDNTFYTPTKGSSSRSDNFSGSGSAQVLSPNLQFLIYHGMIPDDD